MERYICIHGHFYQPPRENPWLEAVELQDSAYPYHDWNQRITSECYAPNASSRILDEKARVMNIINNYSKMSFDFGPTLLSWMEDNDPETYSAILEADRKSRKNFSGRGSAMAQPYNHMIMPLANTRDKRTQIIWGIEDFKYRFGRDPEGMWLPETAVDLETLDIMAEMGIRFIILAPHQAGRTRKIGEKKWKKADGGQVDPKMPYACLLPSRRHINVFFYDGPVSHDTAFAGLLNDGVTFSGRLTGLFSDEGEEAQVVHIATDGETYGHHHRFGEMALSYCLFHIESNGSAKLTNYGEFLSKHPPMYEVEIIENSSWSCAHGVERWRSNCGCRLGFHSKWTQEWRKPLREALDWLRDMVAPLYEKEMSNYFQDPWKARDEYIRVILKRSDESIRSFLQSSSLRELSKEEVIKSIKFFEMQRHAMLMYTSCGWFFDEISGIETTQILQYAARVIQLGRELTGYDFEPQFVEMLRSAPSNIAQLKNGEGVWESYIRPTIVDLLRVGAHFGVSSLFEDYPEDSQIYCYHARSEMNIREESGRQKLAIGRAHILSEITQEEKKVCFAFLHMGDHNISGGVLEDIDGDVLKSMLDDMQDAFSRSDLTEVVGLINKHFGSQSYTIWHLFKDEQRKVMNIILETTYREIEHFSRQIYENYYPVMQVMKEMHMPIPKQLASPIEYIINIDLKRLFQDDEFDIERLRKLSEEVKKFSFELDRTTLGYLANRKITRFIEQIINNPEDEPLMEMIQETLRILEDIPVEKNFPKAQNVYFFSGKKILDSIKEKAEKGDEAAAKRLKAFEELGESLKVKFSG